MSWFTGSTASSRAASPASNLLLRHDSRVSPSSYNGKGDSGTSANEIASILWSVTTNLGFGIGLYLVYKVIQTTITNADPTNQEVKEANEKTRQATSLARRGIKREQLTTHELIILQDVIEPEKLDATLDMIGGLQDTQEQLKSFVIDPLMCPELYMHSSANTRMSTLRTPPKGVLFYGAPGTGKTMLAKALAKETGATFINLRQSTIQNKWVGEGVKNVSAIFSLARKLAPTIIFIDEIDAFLGHRGTDEDNSTALNMKVEFMTLWDGMLSAQGGGGVMVLGATNRPEALDDAIKRRLGAQFEVGLPNEAARQHILQLILKHEDVSDDLDFEVIASDANTAGFSGSDLHELCRTAALRSVQSYCAASRARAERIKQAASKQAATHIAMLKAHRAPTAKMPLDDPAYVAQLERDLVARYSKEIDKNCSIYPCVDGVVLSEAVTSADDVDDIGPVPTPAPITMADFQHALTKVYKTGAKAQEFHQSKRAARAGNYDFDASDSAYMNGAMQAMFQAFLVSIMKANNAPAQRAADVEEL